MDIFIISTGGSIDDSLIEPFQKREISDLSKRREHCMAYYALDRILESVYKIQNREIEFINKKPFLKSREKFFSISHSKEYTALVFAGSDCGIDIEEMKERNFKKIAERMNFQNCKTPEDFYKAWTNFEANYKLGCESCTTVNFKHENYQVCAVCKNIKEPYQIFFKKITDFSNSGS